MLIFASTRQSCIDIALHIYNDACHNAGDNADDNADDADDGIGSM